MKKVILLSISLCAFLTSCVYNDNAVRKYAESISIGKHHYLIWRGYGSLNAVVHDPECPCHLDTVDIWVERNDTIYRIRKK